MDKDDSTTLTKERYKELLYAERVLNALYDGGVTNWDWYDESLQSVHWPEDE